MRCKRLIAIAWLIMSSSALGSCISLFAFANWLVGGYGSQSGSWFEWVSIVLGPPVTFLAGLGLLRHWRPAWLYLIVLLFIAVAVQGWNVLLPPPGGPITTVGPDGVPTTTFHSGSSEALPILVVSIALLAVLFSAKVRATFTPPAAPVEETKAAAITLTRGDYDAVAEREIDRGWRVGHHGRDLMYYEESNGGDWRGIQIDGEMLTGRAHHVIYFASAESWHSYPEWARHRRDPIITRIKSEFAEPDYEYAEGGTARATPPPPAPAPTKAMTSSELRALLCYLAILLSTMVFMAWLVTTGLQRDETYWPSKRHTQQRMLVHRSEPAMYWTSMAIYSGVGLGSLVLAACLIRWSLPERKK
ncbi:MAG: hypothetical protein EAZ42_10525 [Verrucomicrobia bacterium]|nr:MAG: hypothetical protein EAZ42_10525 [Verrucomicrobiota bacterium]